MTDHAAGIDTGSWQAFAPAEREDFLEAAARHRRAAWRVTGACALAYTVLGIVVAVLMAPLLYCVLGLALDLVNLVVPMPDLLGFAGRLIDPLLDDAKPVQVAQVVRFIVLAAIPGLCIGAVAVLGLRRALLQSPMFQPDKPFGRSADPTQLAELQIANTVEEMAIAATIPTPRVVFIDGSGNAAAFGVDSGHATVMIGAQLAQSLTRAQMQAVAGHLVASIADGDMTIGLRTALTLGVFSLAARLSNGWNERAGYAATMRLLRAVLTPTAANLPLILAELSDPFGPRDKAGNVMADDHPADAHAQALAHAAAIKAAMRESSIDSDDGGSRDRNSNAGGTANTLSWREWLGMPLMGPVFLSGFLAGLVNTMLLAPLVSVAWRQRKYMADATAVRLTRDPESLDGALIAIASTGGAAGIDAWAGHLCIVDPGTSRNAGLIGKAWVPIFPSPTRRHQSLVRMGAPDRADAIVHQATMPLPTLLLLVAAGAVVVSLLSVAIVLLVWVSAAVSALFTILPVALLHALLR